MSDAQDETPKFTGMMVTPEVTDGMTPEQFTEAYYKANPWAKPEADQPEE